MTQYHSDLYDIKFNLFKVYNVHTYSPQFNENYLKDILEEFNKFTEKEIYPTRAKGDSEGVHLIDNRVHVPKCFHRPHSLFYNNGWFSLGYPENIGGIPTPHVFSFACASLAIGANVAFSMYNELSKGVLNVILAIGSEQQKTTYIPSFMEGKWGGTMCLTESHAGSDVGATTTTATLIKDDLYSIKGVKMFISSGDNDLFKNNIHLVLARLPGSLPGSKGLSLFLVPRYKITDDKQDNFVTCTKLEKKMGIHGQATCELTFGNGGICRGELIGKLNEGIKNMFIMMNEARLLCGLQGQAQASLATLMTEKYARERKQFRRPIMEHPDIKKTLLVMRASSRGMRGLLLYTAHLVDFKEETIDELSFLTPICKAYCADEGFNLSVDAVQVYGGYGYCSEYNMEQFIRDTKIASIYEGSNGIQAIDFVVRKILKDRGTLFKKMQQKMLETIGEVNVDDFSYQLSLMKHSIKKADEIFDRFARNKIEETLVHATQFLKFYALQLISWQLLKHACLAMKALETDSKNEEDEKFYKSKIIDFKIFCQFKLKDNIGIAKSILDLETDIHTYTF